MKKKRRKNNDNTPDSVKKIADSIIYIALALTVIGINFKPYFEAKRDIAIEEAKAKSRASIIKMEIELEKAKSSDKECKIDNSKLELRLEALEENSHKPQ